MAWGFGGRRGNIGVNVVKEEDLIKFGYMHIQ